nr:polysaccharide deacetylase family protein [candidate division KSB1 bacterium]NIR66334.1 polysaccharide deacetylase family protein [candidate division Zixibacteria bacterium]NIW47472.1 polysaccharide deacetylase family protein [Gammaproteobacteria bacterium]NIS47943.1 polysaccharide deacetylase family protein [candidate division Zixibacteria bacterium]NIT73901.1 polysaccharide deacetylase family protein [candidate division KSB1 bacterium]
HQIGSHSFYHLPLFGLKRRSLLRQIEVTDRLILKYVNRLSNLFRPPYGIFNPKVFPLLQSTAKRMVLWSIIANDFKWGEDRILDRLTTAVQPGDVIVFHDSPQTEKVLMKVLTEFIEHCNGRGWGFGVVG